MLSIFIAKWISNDNLNAARDRIFVKGYEFLSFAENMGENIVKSSM